MPIVGREKIRAVVKVASWQSSGRHFGRRFGNRVALGEVPYDFAQRENPSLACLPVELQECSRWFPKNVRNSKPFEEIPKSSAERADRHVRLL